MNKYNLYKIEDLGDVVTGRTPKTNEEENYGHDYMFIGPVDLHKHFFIKNSEKMISEKGFSSIKSSAIDGTSILVGCIGWDMGNVAIVEGRCVTNQQINSITNIKNEFNPLYIYYWLKGKKDFLFQQASVTRTPILNKSSFSSLKINIPTSRVEQDKIVSILSDIDKKIELNNRINAELEAMAKTLYDYWFVQFDFPDENGQPYKSSGGKMIYNKTLKREIPINWKVENLAKSKLTSIISPGISSFTGKKTYLSTSEVEATEIIKHSNLESFSDRPSRANMQPIKDSVWFARMQNTKKLILVGEYAEDLIKNYIFSTGFAGLKTTNNSTFYIWNYVNNDWFEFVKDINATGSTQKAIINDAIANIPLVIPNSNLLSEYNDRTLDTYEHIYLNQKENIELTKLRDWLLPMLMNGQVTIK
ncbi:MAG: restriction endonuclease subunit S [Thiomicrorhabdus chilensis]|uniref:restriction endonuclease subunit S n=1 Tax=Thiomicrorhabdus chilensis TaxID=63656 RepID=UPI00299EFE4E|nr:restriction endonuclease subunit S [Thiomicrorhabdus chilensis]MDX1346972.1 restriction endonuclease subunit S [Thiomicrorhabdus chilensis]